MAALRDGRLDGQFLHAAIGRVEELEVQAGALLEGSPRCVPAADEDRSVGKGDDLRRGRRLIERLLELPLPWLRFREIDHLHRVDDVA